jgi:hypothetical protein
MGGLDPMGGTTRRVWVLGTSCENSTEVGPIPMHYNLLKSHNKLLWAGGPNRRRSARPGPAFWREIKAIAGVPKGSYFGADSHTGKRPDRLMTSVAPTEIPYARLRAVTVGNIRASSQVSAISVKPAPRSWASLVAGVR